MGTLTKNSDGLYEHYGTRAVANNVARNVPGNGLTKTVVVDFDYSAISTLTSSKPATFWGGSTPNTNAAAIPADSRIVGVSLFINTALSGNSSVLQVGLWDKSGSAIDADGLIKSLSEASTDAANDKVFYDPNVASVASVSPLMGTVASASNAAYIGMYQSAASKAFTAGTGKLVVEYIPSVAE